MKKLSSIVLSLFVIMMSLSLGTISASAYDYELSVSGGNGTIEASGNIARVTGGASDNLIASVDTTSATVDTFKLGGKDYKITAMPDGKSPAESKYFVRGLKLAGNDNDTCINQVNVNETGGAKGYHGQDIETVLAYGLKSSMVSYTVSYLLADGSGAVPGLSTETHYGVIGDRVILSYKYADGYVPDGYTGTAVLSADESQNQFTFYYTPGATNATTQTIVVNDGTAAGGAGNAGAGGATGADGGTTIGDGATPLAGPNDVVDLSDNNTPLAQDPDGTDIDDNDVPLINWPVAGGIGVLLLAILIAALILAKKKREEAQDGEE